MARHAQVQQHHGRDRWRHHADHHHEPHAEQVNAKRQRPGREFRGHHLHVAHAHAVHVEHDHAGHVRGFAHHPNPGERGNDEHGRQRNGPFAPQQGREFRVTHQ
jgi:hypothetical protein